MPRRNSSDLGLMDALVQVSFALMAALTQLGASRELSLTQLRVMAILRDREPRMAPLADYLGLDRSTISGLIDRAARRGLVERFSDPADGRSVAVRLTAEGHRLAEELTAEMGEVVEGLTSELAPEERQALESLLWRTIGGPR